MSPDERGESHSLLDEDLERHELRRDRGDDRNAYGRRAGPHAVRLDEACERAA